MPLPLTVSLASVKSRLVLPFWYRLTWVVPEKRLLNGCVCVRVRVRVCVCVCVICSIQAVSAASRYYEIECMPYDLHMFTCIVADPIINC